MICGDPALEEVGQFLNILKVHEAERVFGVEDGGDSEALQAGVGDVAEILTHIAQGETGDASCQEVFCELSLCIDRFVEHGDDFSFELLVPEVRLLGADDVDHFEGEFEVAALIAEDPVGAGGEAVKQTFRAEEVDVGKCGEEEETFNAGGEADDVEEELAAMLSGLE